MAAVEFSKCKKCHQILHVNKLKDSDDGIGQVCIDDEQCKKVITQSNSKRNRRL